MTAQVVAADKEFTVVGIYEDTDNETYVDHILASSAEAAAYKVSKKGVSTVCVFEGFIFATFAPAEAGQWVTTIDTKSPEFDDEDDDDEDETTD